MLIVLVILTVILIVTFGVSGVITSLAAGDWLICLAIVATAFAFGLLFYRAMLRSWAQQRRHPISLRIVSGVVGLALWLVGFCAVFAEQLAVKTPLGPRLMWIVIGFFIALVGVAAWSYRDSSRRA